MTGDRELMRMHVAALFTDDAAGRMVRVNEPWGADAPRFFLGRTAEGSEVRFRGDVDAALARELEAAAMAASDGDPLAPVDPARFQALLARAAPVRATEAGPAYCFPADLPPAPDAVPVTHENADLLRPHLAAWLVDVGPHQPMLAVLRDGCAVAVCCSVRVTPEADEAGVETAPGFRGHGFAVQVVAAWAAALRRMGRIPLYSTSWENAASRAVARKLGLRQFGSDLHIT